MTTESTEELRLKVISSQVKAAAYCQDQLVMTYENKDRSSEVRFVTPLELSEDGTKVMCLQHLPQNGYRHFFLDKIRNLHRVITRKMIEELPVEKGTETDSPVIST